MSVDVPVGGAMISTSAGVAYYVWNNAPDNVSVSTSSPSNPRKDILVAYVNLAAISSASADNPSAFSFMVVAGTPAASPADPSDSTIQAAVGSGNPYIKLRRIAVATSATTIVNANITDISSPMALAMPYLYGGSSNTKGHLVPNQADGTLVTTTDTGSVSSLMLAAAAITLGYAESSSAHNTGAVTSMVDVSGLTITVTVPTGTTRRLEIEGWIGSVLNASGTGTNTLLAIREGSTTLSFADIALPTSDQRKMGSVKYSAVVSAGSHTYKLSTQNSVATNIQYNMGATNKGFISAKLV
jgi:hypothetical protein